MDAHTLDIARCPLLAQASRAVSQRTEHNAEPAMRRAQRWGAGSRVRERVERGGVVSAASGRAVTRTSCHASLIERGDARCGAGEATPARRGWRGSTRCAPITATRWIACRSQRSIRAARCPAASTRVCARRPRSTGDARGIPVRWWRNQPRWRVPVSRHAAARTRGSGGDHRGAHPPGEVVRPPGVGTRNVEDALAGRGRQASRRGAAGCARPGRRPTDRPGRIAAGESRAANLSPPERRPRA